MGTRRILLRALRRVAVGHPPTQPLRVLELGAGDGSLLLGVARAGRPHWPEVELCLLDRQPLVERATLSGYADAGWAARARAVDVMDWARNPFEATPHWNLIVANLFMHHFEPATLTMLLDVIASRTDRFLACEPRRSRVALAGSHLVGLLGANAVTRQDAVLSVHAGFLEGELTALWPAQAVVHGEAGTHRVRWRMREYASGLFSHCFEAERLKAG
jgi:hypothetical protein